MVNSDQTAYWRRTCEQAIRQVLDGLEPGLSYHVRRARLSKAYPFGERPNRYTHSPRYRVWLAALRRLCPPPSECNPTETEPRLELSPWTRSWWIIVRCPWCGKQTGCLVCGPTHEELHKLVDSPEWKQWLAVLADEPEVAPIVGDWLEERGYPELGQQFRAELQTKAKRKRKPKVKEV